MAAAGEQPVRTGPRIYVVIEVEHLDRGDTIGGIQVVEAIDGHGHTPGGMHNAPPETKTISGKSWPLVSWRPLRQCAANHGGAEAAAASRRDARSVELRPVAPDGPDNRLIDLAAQLHDARQQHLALDVVAPRPPLATLV